MKTYEELASENKYLYGQLENCTLLIGHALLHNEDDSYMNYTILKQDILDKINHNLELIETIWETPVSIRSARKIPILILSRNEELILSYYKLNPKTTCREIAIKLNLTKCYVENIITQYIAGKYGKEDSAA